MKLTVKELNIISTALEARKSSLEWDVRVYDDEGNRVEGKYDTESVSYPEFSAIGKLLERIEKTEV